jgi:uncharacterized protein
MNLEEKLRQLRQAASKTSAERELERQLANLRRLETRAQAMRVLPAERVPHGIEAYVEGNVESNAHGEYFLARQALPFGRPYGKLRVGDIAALDFGPLRLFFENDALPDPSEIVFLDTETTGLAGGTGTCAFLIGVGTIEGSEFVVRQFFLRDYPEERAILASLSHMLSRARGLATFNGKTFDVPLLETRYALARLRSPFARLLHFDLLHPARQLWKLRLESCQLTNLEREILKIHRKGDVDGAEIPQLYFDYLRTGNARGLQPVFYHNALDIVTLAALTAELARAVAEGGEATLDSSLDLFGLSRLFDRYGERERSIAVCEHALERGLPGSVEERALWQLAYQHKRRRQYERAVEIWAELNRRAGGLAIAACEQLAIHYEHRCRDARRALEFAVAAVASLEPDPQSPLYRRWTHRLARLERKALRPARLL